jgi:hypothetical protein
MLYANWLKLAKPGSQFEVEIDVLDAVALRQDE